MQGGFQSSTMNDGHGNITETVRCGEIESTYSRKDGTTVLTGAELATHMDQLTPEELSSIPNATKEAWWLKLCEDEPRESLRMTWAKSLLPIGTVKTTSLRLFPSESRKMELLLHLTHEFSSISFIGLTIWMQEFSSESRKMELFQHFLSILTLTGKDTIPLLRQFSSESRKIEVLQHILDSRKDISIPWELALPIHQELSSESRKMELVNMGLFDQSDINRPKYKIIVAQFSSASRREECRSTLESRYPAVE